MKCLNTLPTIKNFESVQQEIIKFVLKAFTGTNWPASASRWLSVLLLAPQTSLKCQRKTVAVQMTNKSTLIYSLSG